MDTSELTEANENEVSVSPEDRAVSAEATVAQQAIVISQKQAGINALIGERAGLRKRVKDLETELETLRAKKK